MGIVGAIALAVVVTMLILRKRSMMKKQQAAMAKPKVSEHGDTPEAVLGTIVIPLTEDYGTRVGMFSAAGKGKKHKSKVHVPINMTLSFFGGGGDDEGGKAAAAVEDGAVNDVEAAGAAEGKDGGGGGDGGSKYHKARGAQQRQRGRSTSPSRGKKGAALALATAAAGAAATEGEDDLPVIEDMALDDIETLHLSPYRAGPRDSDARNAGVLDVGSLEDMMSAIEGWKPGQGAIGGAASHRSAGSKGSRSAASATASARGDGTSGAAGTPVLPSRPATASTSTVAATPGPAGDGKPGTAPATPAAAAASSTPATAAIAMEPETRDLVAAVTEESLRRANKMSTTAWGRRKVTAAAHVARTVAARAPVEVRDTKVTLRPAVSDARCPPELRAEHASSLVEAALKNGTAAAAASVMSRLRAEWDVPEGASP